MPHTRPGAPLRLLTIPISHFCEKARWALERAGLDYREEAHLQGIHMVYAMRAARGRRVPVLITEQGAFNESGQIIRWIDQRLPPSERLIPDELRGEIDELERRLDEGVGVEGRRWMYSVLMETDIPTRFGSGPLPAWERRVLPYGLPALRLLLKPLLNASPEQAADALAKLNRGFDKVAAMLADDRPYLLGDRFTAADLAFAALSAAVLLPERYGVQLPQPADLPPAAAAEVERLRAHPAGEFAARIVAEHRPWPPPTHAAQPLH